jgi:misacylated tRNA(Ala) deacylase
MNGFKTAALFDESPYETKFSASVVAIKANLIALDRTLFYPTGGGQPGDIGKFALSDGAELQVVDTFRDHENRSIIWHRVDSDTSSLHAGLTFEGEIDWRLRYQHMKMHTCLHLLCAIIDAPVTGCGISCDKGRLDFDLPDMKMTRDDITRSINDMIRNRTAVDTLLVPPAEHSNAMNLVRNKYAFPPVSDNPVKIIRIGDIDIQPCGGTHLRNTSEIGEIICEKIDKKGKQNRRIVLKFAEC